MECTQKQQIFPNLEASLPTKIGRVNVSGQNDVYDRDAIEYRRHLASEAGIRELERRRDLSMAAVQRMSFIR